MCRYLATGDLPFTIALAFRIGESTVREVVKEVCRILIKVLEPLYLSSPTEEDWKKCIHGYWRRWNIPNCVGSVDGKHVRLRCPPNSGSLYYNYKNATCVIYIWFRFCAISVTSRNNICVSVNILKELINELFLVTLPSSFNDRV